MAKLEDGKAPFARLKVEVILADVALIHALEILDPLIELSAARVYLLDAEHAPVDDTRLLSALRSLAYAGIRIPEIKELATVTEELVRRFGEDFVPSKDEADPNAVKPVKGTTQSTNGSSSEDSLDIEGVVVTSGLPPVHAKLYAKLTYRGIPSSAAVETYLADMARRHGVEYEPLEELPTAPGLDVHVATDPRIAVALGKIRAQADEMEASLISLSQAQIGHLQDLRLQQEALTRALAAPRAPPCVVCGSPNDVVFVPCGHGSLCQPCVANDSPTTCPICEHPVMYSIGL